MGRREDPHETKDLAKELPDVLESLKQRYLELKATALDQRVMLSKVQAATQRLFPNWIKMLQNNKGFVSLEQAAFLRRADKPRAKLSCAAALCQIGPWCTEGACSPVAANATALGAGFSPEGMRIELPYGLGGEFPGMEPWAAF